MSDVRSELLHECFSRAAALFPDAIAIDVPPSGARRNRLRCTYAQLDQDSDRLAQTLHARGTQLEEIVVALLPREDPTLYAAQLGVLKSGGAYCALDPKFPDAHIQSVLDDCAPRSVLTNAVGITRLTALGVDARCLVDAAAVVSTITAPTHAALPLLPREASRLAYSIYTSGTTGKPKGVLLEHRGIVNLVESDRSEFGLRAGDRVAQCSSPAYDSSIEETYLAFASGATLVPLDDETVRLGPDLLPFLRDEQINVFCPPPTLLRALGCIDPSRELPALRLLYVGGEALPQDLADVFAPHCRLENGYGPTECSVTVTRSTVHAGAPVTIGRAVPNNRAYILDERAGTLVRVADGESGELCIAGAGLARGYRGDAALTASKFPTVDGLGRIYRTGDLARVNSDGALEFLGRIDAQVKLRGYRVELGAVEQALLAIDGVKHAAAAVQLRGDEPRLVAFLVATDAHAPPSLEHVRAALRVSLPIYMVPSDFAFLLSLPTSIAGKLDRKQLPQLFSEAITSTSTIDALDAPRDALERAICHAFSTATHRACGRSSDFFTALDGDSLTAVAAVLILRRETPSQPSVHFERVSVRDIYTARTAMALAQSMREATSDAQPLRARRSLSSRGNAYIASALRLAAMLSGVVLSSGATMLGALWLFESVPLEIGSIAWFIASVSLFLMAPLAWLVLTLALAVAAKRWILGRVRNEVIGYWSWRGSQLWVAAGLSRLIPWGLVYGTTLEGWMMRRLGAVIGDRVHFARGVELPHGAFDLLEIGDDACFAQDSALRALSLEDGHLLAGHIRVGAGTRVGVRAALEPHSIVEECAEVGALSLVDQGQTVPAHRLWIGVPARDASATRASPTPRDGRAMSSNLHALLALVGRATGISIFVNALIAALVTFGMGHVFASLHAGAMAPANVRDLLLLVAIASLLFVPIRIVGTALLCRLLPRVREGTFHRYSATSLLATAKTQMLDDACVWLSGSMYWPVWLRVAGAKIGRGCEISTIMGTIPEMLTVGDESFFADGIYLASAEPTSDAFTVRATSIGARTFIGNHAVLAQGASWCDDLFVGVSTAPDAARVRERTGWFGVPTMELPRREIAVAPREDTHDPSMIRRCNRLAWETLRIAVPVFPAIMGTLASLILLEAHARGMTDAMIAWVLTPSLFIASAITLGAMLIATKWILLGRVQPGQHALWSCWCSRWDFLYVVWGYWGRRALASLQGTLLLNAYLRLSGAHIGKRVVLGPGFTQLVDPDMLTFEDDATVACQFQAHSFEDRILKIDRLRVGARASIGEQTVVFYGVDVGEAAIVRPNGIVMKRTHIAPNTDCCGAPC